ncbi:hypothetical protein Tco_1051702 [Tanacetum coccineum]
METNKLVLLGKVGAARHKVSAARQKFMLLVTVTTFWNTASSQTVNDEKQIHATVDSKAVVITEASIRSSLLLNDADGTACLTNEAIFQNLALMGKGLNFSGRITPLFSNMLASAKVEEGDGSEQPTKPQHHLSTQPSVGDQPHVTESSSGPDNTHSPSINLEGTGGNEGDQVHVLALETAKDAQAAKILKLNIRIKKLEKKCKPSISHHRAWLKSLKRLSMKKRLGQKEPVSKQGRKMSNQGPSLAAFVIYVDLAHGMDYMDTEEAMTEGRQNIFLTDALELKVQKHLDEEARLERHRQEQASLNYIANLYNEVQARIDVDHEFCQRVKKTRNVNYGERDQDLAEYFEIAMKELVEERAAVIRNKPPTKSQLRSLMMTYLKHTDFVPIGSEEDERLIQKMNKKTDSDLEEEVHLKTFLKLVLDEEGIIDYEVLEKRFPIINWESKFYHLDRHGAECIYYMIFRSDESSRWIKTFSEMVTMFDMLYLKDLYNLAMQRFESTTPEGVDLVL